MYKGQLVLVGELKQQLVYSSLERRYTTHRLSKLS